MHLFDSFKKQHTPKNYTESTFGCQRTALTIRGTEYRPEGTNLPVAIVCHGFMAWQDTVRQYCKLLAEIGYCAYCFDFCGGSVLNKGKSDGKTTEMSVLTEVQDLEAVIEYAQGLPYNSKKTLLMGCSQGGFVSALTAAKHPGMTRSFLSAPILKPTMGIQPAAISSIMTKRMSASTSGNPYSRLFQAAVNLPIKKHLTILSSLRYDIQRS